MPPSKKLAWNERIVLELTGTKDKSWLNVDKKLAFQAPILAFYVPTDDSKAEFQLTYDCPGKFESEAKLCVLVGTEDVSGPISRWERRYVLLIRRKLTSLGAGGYYERIGAGYFADCFLGSEEDFGTINQANAVKSGTRFHVR